MSQIKKLFVCIISFGVGLFVFCSFDFPNIAFAMPKEQKFAKGYCVVEALSGRVLSGEDINNRLPMASTTKIITAILVIENNDIDKVISVPKEAVGIEGSSLYLKEGEHLSIRELLLGLMLRSGNDAAVALAVDTFGSIDAYRKAANAFIERLGLNNTHIVTPNGLHDDEHYTSAYDLAIISSYALKNPIFREIVSTTKATISNEKSKEGKRFLKNKNKLLTSFEGATGVKTGYTKKAGRCLVSSAKRDGMELVCVVLDCPDWFRDSSRLLDEAFEKYKMVEVLPAHYHVGKISCCDGDKADINLVAKNGFSYPLSSVEKLDVRIDTKISDEVSAPICVGDELGQIDVYFKNDLIFSFLFTKYLIHGTINLYCKEVILWIILIYQNTTQNYQ